MVEAPQTATEGEAPVNPFSLLEAVNEASDTVSTGWLIFLGIMAYVVIAVAGVTHKDLLLETPVSLPILQVDIELKQFFQFVPIILVLFHLGVVAQLVLLARKTLEFDLAVRLLELTPKRTHPLRLELHSFFFVQAIAGPDRSRVMSAFLHGMSWLTTVILPVLLLLYIQASYLPAHDVTTVWAQRIALVVDLSVLLLIGTFLLRTETSFFQAFMRNTAAHPLNVGFTSMVMLLVLFLSFFAATIPGEALDRMGQAIFPREDNGGGGQRRAEGGFIFPMLASSDDGSLFGLFARNLNVRDTDLVADKDVTPGEPTISLRGRDLRYAVLDRSDLHQADMTGADLTNASLVGADLRGIRLDCADLSRLILTDDRAAADCAFARRADFTKANLEGARFAGADLTGATFDEANLRSADLAYVSLTGAAFAGAKLDAAEITGGVKAEGANFLLASLQGADLTGLHGQGADFSNARLHAATLAFARLDGAVLAGANLDAASLYQARLLGASLAGATITGADFRRSRIWLTAAPEKDASGTANFADLEISAPGDADVAELTSIKGRIADLNVARRVAFSLEPLIAGTSNGTWPSSDDMARWSADAATGSGAPGTPVALTQGLANLMCKTRWSDGAIAIGVTRRAMAAQFTGDRAEILRRLQAPECPGGSAVPAEMLRNFKALIDVANDSGG